MYAKAKNYLVSISIIEGRHFAWPNMDSAVLVRVHNQKRCTKVIRSTDCPFFSEYFVFEFHIKHDELLDKNITLTVIKPRTCCSKKKILGYVTLDVATVWDHDDHQFYHKWAIIMAPTSESVAGARGYLKVDICVLSKGESPKIPDMVDNNDEIEGNLLLPEGLTTERVRTNYTFCVYKGENLIKLKSSKGSIDKSSPNACLEISFVGIKGRTSVQKDEAFPEWNEKVTLTELFPPLCQRIKLKIKHVDCLHSTVCAVHYINLRNISNDGERGFLPTFGPSFIHFYNRGAYAGQVLFLMKTELHDAITLSKDAAVEQIPPLNEPSLMRYDDVLLFATIFEVTAIHKMFSNKPISFEMSCGAKVDTDDSGSNRLFDMEPYTHDDCTWYLDIEHEKPCLHISSPRLDFRRRMYNTNMLEKICIETKKQLDEIKSMFDKEINPPSRGEIESSIVNMLDNLSSSCRKYIDISSSAVGIGNDLDKERLRMCLEEMGQIEETCKRLYHSTAKKKSFRKAEKLYEKLHLLTEEPQDCWPDVIIKMFYGGKPIAFHQFPARQIAFSIVEEESGINCGKLQDIYIKMVTRKGIFSDQNTICRLNVRFWFGLERHKEHCFNSLPPSFRGSIDDPERNSLPEYLVTEEEQVFQCRAHIYQGRISPGADSSGLCDALTKVLIGEHCKTTQVKKATLNPIWDESLIFNNIVLYGNIDFIKKHPPPVVLIVLDQDVCYKTDCIGRVVVEPVIKFSNQSYTSPTYPPKLQWYKLYNDEDSLGDILAVVELLQKTGSDDEDEDDEKSAKEIVRIPSDIKPTLEQYRIEVVFWGLRDMKKIYMLPITKPKIKLEISGEILQSESIPDTRKSLNFPDPLKYIDVDLPTNEEYAPPLCLKMFDRRSFGRNTYAGTSIVSVQSCLFHPLLAEEREQKLSGIGITSFDDLNFQAESSIRFLSIEQLRTTTKSMETVPVSEVEKPLKKRKWRNKFLKLIRRNATEEDEDESNEISVTDETDDEHFDWWTKYYASIEPENQNSANPITKVPRLKIYSSELEKQPEFNNFSDLLKSFPMYKGKRTGDETVDEENITGVFKGAIKIYRSPLTTELNYVTPSGLTIRDGAFQDFPLNEHMSYSARVYCVKGINLRPKDISGKSDPYIYIKMNGQVINDRENYVPNQVNPIFGRCFEIEGILPMDHTIKIALWDWDMTSADDLIGETTIDLENRVFTNHRAVCGLPLEYHESGYRAWRDYYQPTHILEILCKKSNLSPPEYTETSVRIGNKEFVPAQPVGKLPNSIEQTPVANQRLVVDGSNPNQLKEVCALAALRRWKEIPVIGRDLVPEHVETRSLYHPSKPGIEQGKLQLWIDIFPAADLPTPKPVDITPTKPVSYELRLTIWNTEDVKLEEKDLLLQERVSDIYVKGWVTGPDQAQCTDVHYRSLTGEGNFNWRFVFHFDYLISENKLVVKTKAGFFDLDETEIKTPCKLTLQVWDNDTFSRDDILGVLTLELSHMPKGARHSKYCTLKIVNRDAPCINLFKIKRTKGWWPFRINEEGEGETLTGKVEAEFELLLAEEAEKDPVGVGRNEPHALPEPKRPDTAFSWFRNPLKALKYTVCKLHRKKIAITCLFIGLVLMAGLAIYAFPGYTVKKLLHV